MSIESAPTTARRYVYAIIRNQDANEVRSAGLMGLFDEPVRVDQGGDLAVVSSSVDVETIRPRRQLLTAHQQVVAAISKQWDMLPVSFGLIATDEHELTTLVAANSADLLEAIQRVSGKVEMNLVLSWSVDNVYQHLVSSHAELQAARDRIAQGQSSREEMIELGRHFDQLLQSERSLHADAVTRALGDVCAAIDFQDAKGEKEIVRAQCLIGRDAEPAFTAAVHQLAEQYDANYGFAFNGPWPPYSFVNLKLSLN